jgi:hypothetical protein
MVDIDARVPTLTAARSSTMPAPRKNDLEERAVVDGTSSAPLPETPRERDWRAELDDILDQAAQMATAHDVDPDLFLSAAQRACLRANPELQEQVERMNMLAQMEVYRRMGVLAQA